MDFRAPLASVAWFRYGAPTMASVHKQDDAQGVPVTIEDVRAAHARIAPSIVRTPILKSRTLSEITGANVWLKFENLQFTAAYKERGALNALLLLTQEAGKVPADRMA